MRDVYFLPKDNSHCRKPTLGVTYVDLIETDKFRFAIPFITSNYVIYDSMVLVCYKPEHLAQHPGEKSGCNIWCYNFFGDLQWKIKENNRRRHYLESIDHQAQLDEFHECYTCINYNKKNNNIFAETQTSSYTINIKNGNITPRQLVLDQIT